MYVIELTGDSVEVIKKMRKSDKYYFFELLVCYIETDIFLKKRQLLKI